MKKCISFAYAFLFLVMQGSAQDIPGTPKVYPANWWVGMHNPALQLMIHGDRIGGDTAVRIAYEGVKLVGVHRADNPNYLFLDLLFSPFARPGTLRIGLGRSASRTDHTISFALRARRPGNGTQFAQGVTASDLIYFLMPDRFCNGDPGNDRIRGMRDQSLDRDSMYFRHGGDMEGVIKHLDYIQGLGATTLWMTPVLENDMPNRTEHGYAITDHYTIDPRLGGARAYLDLSDSLHRRGMKLIQDAVYNHVGKYHFTVQDPPFKDWLHQWPVFTKTNNREQPLVDPHAAAIDKKLMTDGWFTSEMPDLNQDNPFVAHFLIQNAIWCVEEFGVDAWRIDTYMYCDPDFMNRCNKALFDEYPHITMFGEAWAHSLPGQAYFAQNNMKTSFSSNLPGVLDFQCLFNGIRPALNDTGKTNDDGVNKLYTTLSNDFLYKDPTRNVIFLDNHDMSRFFSEVKEDVAKQVMGIEWLLTCRGIPQLYYGTEILMKGSSPPDGRVRSDFPGGWAGDRKNAFTGEGLSPDEAGVQALVRKLGQYRKGSSALRTGKLMQYAPKDGCYVYFRYDTHQTVMCIMNTGKDTVTVDPGDYAERTAGFTRSMDVLSDRIYPALVTVSPMQMRILELLR